MLSFMRLISYLLLTANVFTDKAILVVGCFWCMELDFEKLEGVGAVISGFTGGTLKNPIYHGNHQGHYEDVGIFYDPVKDSYETLLDFFGINIDSFDPLGQFCDKGFSCLSAIFVANDSEKRLAD